LKRRGIQYGLRSAVTDAAEQEVDLVAFYQFRHHFGSNRSLCLVIPHDVTDAFAVDATGSIEGIEIGFDPGHIVATDRGVRAGQVDRLSDHDGVGFLCRGRAGQQEGGGSDGEKPEEGHVWNGVSVFDRNSRFEL